MMDVFDEIELHKDALTPAEEAVCRIVQEHPDAILGCTSNELARRYGVSQSAVSRFCQKLGFAGYGEFRMELHKTLTLRSFGGDAEPEDRISCLTRLMQAVSDAVGPETFASFYGRMEKARNVYVFGAGQSSIPARMLAGRLLEDSVAARYVALGYETEALHCMSDQDEVVIFSAKNDTFRQLLTTAATIEDARRPHITLIATTAKHPSRKHVDDVIVLPTWSDLKLPLYLEPQHSMIFFCMLVGGAPKKRSQQS